MPSSVSVNTSSVPVNTPSVSVNTPSVSVNTPSVSVNTPSVSKSRFVPSSVSVNTPSVSSSVSVSLSATTSTISLPSSESMMPSIGLSILELEILRSNDWINDTIINRNRALIYDSLVPRKPSYNLKQQICSFVRPLANSFIFDILNIIPQPNSYDCGVIAIHMTVELLQFI